jgi:hypothetical protein
MTLSLLISTFLSVKVSVEEGDDSYSCLDPLIHKEKTMNVTMKVLLIVCIAGSVIGYSTTSRTPVSPANTVAAPPFIRVGKIYKVGVSSLSLVRVLEIGTGGWVKFVETRPGGVSGWLNINQVPYVAEQFDTP